MAQEPMPPQAPLDLEDFLELKVQEAQEKGVNLNRVLSVLNGRAQYEVMKETSPQEVVELIRQDLRDLG